MSSMGELTFFLGLQVKQKEDGIFITQDKYVAEILKKFDFLSVKTASTPIETQKPLVKDKEAADVDVYVTPKTLHLQAVKRIFRYLKGQSKLGLWYPKVSSFDLKAYSDSDYAGENLDKKSTTEGCQFLVKRLISWQCKKQTIVATSTTDKELASPKQTALGKDILNLLMAVYTYYCQLKVNTASLKLTIAKDSAAETKPTESEGFEQIIDFLNGSSVRYALTASPTIQGTSCLAIAKIFDGLAKMGYEKLSEKLTFYKAFFSPQWKFLIHNIECLSAKITSWNEFSSTMASAIICLATNQKFNFSRYILLSLVKNIEAGVPFFMFPRFVQLLIDHQLGDMSHHKDIYDNPSLTKKVFANMKRVGTGFSGVVIALFDNMLVPIAEEVGLIQDDIQLVPIPTKPSTSKPHKKHKPKKQQPQAHKVPSLEPSPKHKLPSPSNDPLPGSKDSMKLKELMDLCTHLSNKVLELKSEVIDIKSTYKDWIKKLEGRVDKLEEENRVLKELRSVHSKVDIAAPVVEKEKSFKQGRIIAYIDEDVEINLEEAQAKLYRIDLKHPQKVLSMQDVDDEEPAEEVVEVVKAAKLMTEVVTTTGATTTADAKKLSVPRRRRGVVIQDLEETTSIIVVHSEHYNYNQAFLEEVNEEVTVPEKEVEVEAHKREGESLEKEITKKQKMGEEAEELKSHLQIVSNDDDDDVYIEATPLASKIPIVDYKIHFERNKPYFNIIRADGNHMLFLSFSTLLKKIDREDLESLWKLVKEMFEKIEPKNYSDDYLLKTLKIMFEQPNVKASVWRDQKGRYGLAKRYPLTYFTLEQMMSNVRREVEEESEMSLELLRLVRR
nr:uncharacterized mitochondrial protein AtMg00810-like [Tanacetum cinerariifolium]